jgi:hypothetical protein
VLHFLRKSAQKIRRKTRRNKKQEETRKKAATFFLIHSLGLFGDFFLKRRFAACRVPLKKSKVASGDVAAQGPQGRCRLKKIEAPLRPKGSHPHYVLSYPIRPQTR